MIDTQLWSIDPIRTPLIYPTNNPKYFGDYCIDFFPETVPTIASFETEFEAHAYLIKEFGEKQHKQWFPFLYKKEHATCRGCRGYKAASTIKR